MSTASVRPVTVTGVVESVLVPLPSCPERFQPQQATVLSLRIAHAAGAGREYGDVGETTHRYRGGRVGEGTVTELPEAVITPAGNADIATGGARVTPTGVDARSVSETSHDNRRVREGVGPVTELPIIVVAPAHNCVVTTVGTRVVLTGADAGNAGKTGHGDRGVRVGVSAVAELPPAVVAPTGNSAVATGNTRDPSQR